MKHSTFFIGLAAVAFVYASACSTGNEDIDDNTQVDSDTNTAKIQDTNQVDVGLINSLVGNGNEGTDSLNAKDKIGCGNGVIEIPEVCDDGNNVSLDGCTALCDAVEKNYFCSVPNEPCVYIIVCGDGQVSGSETCDDFNTASKDGCAADCQLESGWSCPTPGKQCVAATCGDGLIAGNENCDDGNGDALDGCSDNCRLEDEWACEIPGKACHQTVCNDGVKEGKEPCDDGNNVIGDGCNPFCEIEPDCTGGTCVSACGDGIILPGDNEACDDGNQQNNDGCSNECQIESGYICNNVEKALPEVLEVPVTYRDFIAKPLGDAVRHPDFEFYSGSDVTPSLVADTLGEDGKPVYTGICEQGNTAGDCPYNAQTTSETDFNQWYRDVPEVNHTRVVKMALAQQTDDTYYFESNAFFPVDDFGWVEAKLESTANEHNFGFTSELRYWFKFKGGESLLFTGDDDVWVFINGKLAVDIGGLHASQSREVTLDELTARNLGLEKGNIYETVLFHAERHTAGSRFHLTLSGFTTIDSECESDCGDGIVAGNETCDDGVNDGSYGSCLPNCTHGERCGDGVLQESKEVCDDGVNLTVYSASNQPGCAPGCVEGFWCGDGLVQIEHGEKCDDGNNVSGDSCSPDCQKILTTVE